jgi:2-polyprenyl-3-methyl-5-hydroxy-6-metoxy-1,4-benzoquinol methylase
MGPFNALTLFQVLEHLDEPHSLMLQLRELVADGGILVLETPNCSGVTDIKTRYEYSLIHPLEHINAFTPETLKDFANRVGFVHIDKQVSIISCDFNEVTKKIAKRFLKPLVKPTTQLYFRKV